MTDDGYGGMIPALDPYTAADVLLDAERDASACAKCGAPDPARLDADGCSECRDYPRCFYCRTWVGDGSTWLPGYHAIDDGRGGFLRCCERCWEKAT